MTVTVIAKIIGRVREKDNNDSKTVNINKTFLITFIDLIKVFRNFTVIGKFDSSNILRE